MTGQSFTSNTTGRVIFVAPRYDHRPIPSVIIGGRTTAQNARAGLPRNTAAFSRTTAAGIAARDAARATLAPTVTKLQDSAADLVRRMALAKS